MVNIYHIIIGYFIFITIGALIKCKNVYTVPKINTVPIDSFNLLVIIYRYKI